MRGETQGSSDQKRCLSGLAWPGIAASLVVIKDFDASSSPVMDGILTFASMKKIEVDVDREIYRIFFMEQSLEGSSTHELIARGSIIEKKRTSASGTLKPTWKGSFQK